ncbi:hypothetical protein [Pseudobacillus badius]|uniref:hypothetical protein n=1 Tax=Bacillus badius TaxID=1455 RepID=UPI0007B3A5DC|nr:hypothetical protein [Bacillus badius]KZR56929.1 hypothetical protein A3781_20530 [Bacillus badius]
MENAGCWLCAQFQHASQSVEYVSWITASVFAVLAVFTIFLAHQYETNTTQMVRILWELKETLKKEEKNEFKNLMQQFSYFSKSPALIEKTIKATKRVITFLIFIWSISGLAMISANTRDEQGDFQVISFILIISITFLFIFFSFKMLEVVDELTSYGNSDLLVKSERELRDLPLLESKGFEAEKLIEFLSPQWIIHILPDDPYIKVQYRDELNFINYHVMISFIHRQKKVIFGTYIEASTSVHQFNLTSHFRELNRFFNEEKYKIFDISLTLLINDKAYTYQVVCDNTEASNLPKKLIFKIDKKEEWSPPQDAVNSLEEEKRVEMIRIE